MTITSLATQETLAEKMTGIDLKNKGTVGNRIDNRIEHSKNLLKSELKADAVLLTGGALSVGAAAGVSKSKTLQDGLAHGFKKIANTNFGESFAKALKQTGNDLAPYAEKAIDWVVELPKPAKAVFVAGTFLTSAALRLVNNKYFVKMGQIDQKYTDRAKMQEITE